MCKSWRSLGSTHSFNATLVTTLILFIHICTLLVAAFSILVSCMYLEYCVHWTLNTSFCMKIAIESDMRFNANSCVDVGRVRFFTLFSVCSCFAQTHVVPAIPLQLIFYTFHSLWSRVCVWAHLQSYLIIWA